MKPMLTVIIPFKNEGEEVFKTVASLRQMADNDINFIVINDASDDGFDYSGISSINNVEYILHDKSFGPAQSRQHGVDLCQTNFFILVDAHMRAMTKGWDRIVLEPVQKYRNAIFCCVTYDMIENAKSKICRQGYGATIKLEDVSCKWISHSFIKDNKTIIEVPCVLGASYISNKEYWNRIGGLKGLLSYGCEEQLLSIKTYLDGGKCYVLSNVEFSHKFRKAKETPYNPDKAKFIYNHLYIIEIFYPFDLKARAFQKLKTTYDEHLFEEAISILSSHREEINKAKLYYREVLHFDTKTVYEINNKMLNN